MSRFLPYIVKGEIADNPREQIPSFKGLTGSPLEFDPIKGDGDAAAHVHPDVLEKHAQKAKSTLGDEDLVTALKKALEVQTDVQPSNLDWRT